MSNISTCTRCSKSIWLSEFRPGDIEEGYGVWLSGMMAIDAVCIHSLDTNVPLPHVPVDGEAELHSASFPTLEVNLKKE